MKRKAIPATKPTTATLENMQLAELVPHPDQQQYFRTYGEFEYETLKADIKANDVKVPMEVIPPGNAAGLPPFTLLMGHTRTKILLELGKTTAKVLVRYDLMNAKRADIDKLFLMDNVARRQQDRLGQARAAVGLYRIEQKQKGRRVSGNPLQDSDLRDRIGKIVGMSGRNLQRYLNVLEAPIEVQDAFSNGQIKLVDAARVTNLEQKDQEELASRLRSREDAKAVFAAYFPPKDGKHAKLGDAIDSFARSLDKGIVDLGDRIAEVKPGNVRGYEKTLRKGRDLIRDLLRNLFGKTEGPSLLLEAQQALSGKSRPSKRK